MYQAYAKNVVFTGQMEQIRIQLEEDLKRDIDEPLDKFQEQFKILKKRDAERTRRKVRTLTVITFGFVFISFLLFG
jgi:hypothetical protein